MSAPKRGLGKGLSALLGSTPVPIEPQEVLREIAVASIRPNPFQPRKSFDSESLDELKSSIAEYGVLVPVIVRQRGEGYELIAGERRWRACAALEMKTIPAIVRASNDRETLEVAIVENLQRENLNPLEEAAGFQHLIDEYDFTQEDVARRLGKSRPAVANMLRLLTLADPIKAMIAAGQLTAGHAKALLAVPEAERLALARRTVDEGLSVRTVERIAAGTPAPQAEKSLPKPRTLSADEHEFEARLRERFGTHVALVRNARGGHIEFRFGNEEELIRIGDLLLGDAR